MSTIVWPGTLPSCPVENGAALTERASKISFHPEVGLPIERRRGTVRMSERAVTYRMTIEQAQTFRDFFHDTLKGGSLEFATRHPVTGRQIKAKIDGDYDQARFGNKRLVSFLMLMQD